MVGRRKRSTVLDLGGGAAGVAFALSADTDAKIFGIDASPEFIDQARDTFECRISVSAADFDQLPGNLPKYDVIYSVDSLNFSQNLEILVAKLATHLNPGGTRLLFWTQAAEEEERRGTLESGNTLLGRALESAGLSYEFLDFTEDERLYWQKAYDAVRELEGQFKEDGEVEFFEHFCQETVDMMDSVRKSLIRRYAYEVTSPRDQNHSGHTTPASDPC